MDDLDALLPWLAFNRLPELGPVSQRALLDHCGGMAALLSLPASSFPALMPPTAAQAWLAFREAGQQSALGRQARSDAERAIDFGAVVLHAEQPAFPALLAQAHGAPTVLYVRGNPACLHLPQLGLVGSRNASSGGLELAGEFAGALARHGLTITSGLALGIDGAAHRGALHVNGTTLAVVATGIDETYPRRHEALAHEIVASGGAIVTEFPPQTPPAAAHFPRRNRIISGLSLGVLVIEASVQSGSLITARYAMEQGREVFALPGSVRSLHHRGCHALIRQGAILVESTQDILDELGGLLAFKQQECAVVESLACKTDAWSADAVAVFRLLDHTPVPLDVVAGRSQLPVDALSAALMDLEMEGVVVQEHGLYARR